MMTTKTNKLPQEIVSLINEYRKLKHSESYVISVLQKVQSHFGYLPKECMDEVAQLMGIPTARVTGIATFYHLFTFVPKGQTKITICMGTACFVRGADKVLDRLKELLGIKEGQTTPDGKFSIECARCLGACALAPVVVVNEKVYGNVTPSEMEKILSEYGFKKSSKKA